MDNQAARARGLNDI
jgi:hypothetical protein